MFKIITEIWSQDGGKDVLFASNFTREATVVPSIKDRVILRTATSGQPGATSLKVRSVSTLSSLDGYVVTIWHPSLLEDAQATRDLREELLALEWDFVMPEPPLPFLADADDFDDN